MKESFSSEQFHQFFTTKKALMVLVVLTFLILCFFYPKAIFSPNKYLFSDSGDGLKNYYTYAYYIKNDTSFTNSNCVNYPYGEHFNYLDSQPALSFPLKLMSQLFPGIANYSIGILNFFMMLSVLFASIFIFLILKEFKTGNVFALMASLSITFLSPQFLRLSGHYGLFYLFPLPLIWYFIIKFFKTSQQKYTVYITLSLFIIFFIHAYLGLICAAFLFLSELCYFIFYKKNRTLKNILFWFVQIVIPVLLYLAITTFTDTHTDRSDNPAGLYDYNASINTVFLPYNYILQIPYRLLFSIGVQQWEGIGYIGILSNLMLFAFILYLISLLIKRKLTDINQFVPKEMWIFLLSSILLLLISMATPIKFIIDFVLEYIKPLRQFRTLGRFSWPFYYVINIFVSVFIYSIYQQLRSKNKKWFSTVFIIFTQLLFIAEAFAYQWDNSHSFLKEKNKLNLNYLPKNYKEAIGKFDHKQYQAILPIPFFHYGSEDFMISCPEASMQNAMIIAYNKNMPMLASNSPRTSVDEAKNIIQILMPEYYDKVLVDDIKSDKPFLVIYTKNDISPLEKRLLDMSEIFYENKDFALATLNYEKLFYKSQKEILKKYLSIDDSSHFKNNYFVSDTNAFIFSNGYESSVCSIHHSGNGCYKNAKKDYSTLVEFDASKLDLNTTYEVSFWFYNKGYGRTSNMIAIDETEGNSTSSNWISATDSRFCKIIYKDWSLVQMCFTPKGKSYHYKVFIAPHQNWVDSVYVDDLLIRPVNVDVFKVEKGEKNKGILVYNNQFIQTDIDYLVLDCSRELINNFYTECIFNSVEWLGNIKADAIKKKIPLEKAIYDNAEYMTYATLFNITNNKTLKVAYYKQRIKTNKEWLKNIINMPGNKGKNLDSLIYLNALYMAEHH